MKSPTTTKAPREPDHFEGSSQHRYRRDCARFSDYSEWNVSCAMLAFLHVVLDRDERVENVCPYDVRKRKTETSKVRFWADRRAVAALVKS